jgi:hypothetical protein
LLLSKKRSREATPFFAFDADETPIDETKLKNGAKAWRFS